MKEYAIEFAYNEMSLIREMANKKLNEVLSSKHLNVVSFYVDFLDKHNRGVMDIIPCVEEYVLASIIRRCNEMEDKIKKDLTKK